MPFHLRQLLVMPTRQTYGADAGRPQRLASRSTAPPQALAAAHSYVPEHALSLLLPSREDWPRLRICLELLHILGPNSLAIAFHRRPPLALTRSACLRFPCRSEGRHFVIKRRRWASTAPRFIAACPPNLNRLTEIAAHLRAKPRCNVISCGPPLFAAAWQAYACSAGHPHAGDSRVQKRRREPLRRRPCS